MSLAAHFDIQYTRILDDSGHALVPLPPFARDAAALTELYRWMTLIRTFDAKAIALQRTGQLGTFASMLGQEAIQAGIGSAMLAEDVLLSSYREQGALMMRGVTMKDLFLYWGGDERGSHFSGARGDFPICVTIAAHATHAVGVAYAIKLRRQPRVAVCTLGDGATSKGDFYEGLNAAGAWQLPLVFFISNNQWAISTPRTTQTAAQTFAQKAIAGGIEGQQVDGNDVLAVRQVMDTALAKARGGGGPTLIEALTYRLSDHTTADDASRYRSADDVAAAWKHEPLARLRAFLMQGDAWDKAREDALLHECNAQVQAAVAAYQNEPAPALTQLFDHLYATVPAALQKQRAAVLPESP